MLQNKFCCQRRRCCYTTFSFGIQNEILICHNVTTQSVKIARRDRPFIFASNRSETFENLLHIDIAPARTFSGILQHAFYHSISGIKRFMHFAGKFHFLFKTITDSVRLGVVYLNLVFSTANGVMCCEIYLQSVAHITTIHHR